MRLWTIHPEYLDAKGLVALWREALLAQKVLSGNTKGYRNHPQLIRFKKIANPNGAIARYLIAIADEADRRGYQFDRSKIRADRSRGKISVTTGQVHYEFSHLLNKLKIRDPKKYHRTKQVATVKLHPLFTEVSGDVEEWEVVN